MNHHLPLPISPLSPLAHPSHTPRIGRVIREAHDTLNDTATVTKTLQCGVLGAGWVVGGGEGTWRTKFEVLKVL